MSVRVPRGGLAALEHAGFEVDVASEGESALMIAAARAPAVMIVDIRLIALTSRDDPQDRARSIAAGFDVHLVKPVHPAAVEQTIRALLAA